MRIDWKGVVQEAEWNISCFNEGIYFVCFSFLQSICISQVGRAMATQTHNFSAELLRKPCWIWRNPSNHELHHQHQLHTTTHNNLTAVIIIIWTFAMVMNIAHCYHLKTLPSPSSPFPWPWHYHFASSSAITAIAQYVKYSFQHLI